MARLACRRREQQSERGDGGERGENLSDRRVRATRSVLEEIPPSNSGCFECISSRFPAHVADSFVPSRCRQLLTLACGLTPARVRKVEKPEAVEILLPDSESAPPVRAPDPLSLLDPGSSKAITLSHQFRSRLRPRLLSRILPEVNSNADLWNVRHSPALPLRPPPQDHSVHVFTLKLSPTPRRLQSPQEVRRTSVETSESCGCHPTLYVPLDFGQLLGTGNLLY